MRSFRPSTPRRAYTGRPERRVEGGLFGPRVQTLVVNGRDRTRLIEGVHRQVDLVRACLDRADRDGVPVTGVVCFIEADWAWIRAGFTIAGVHVMLPKKLTALLTERPVHDQTRADAIHHALAAHFPPA